ncbi:MAG: hypothetical protein DCC49_03700 [Acidobacteria bacterium]|nr:MAG: hypothetical protein DCC49_03700 [Acidobacteriota bacterium]
MNCSSCGAELPADARYCPACGAAVATRGDERRVATAVFADLVGFTSLGEQMDPENVKNLVDSYFERLVAVVNQFGGRVDKIIGDAIVALFGAPVAHEDDAERAVRAALEMQSLMSQDSDRSGVRMRVGVNTGEVLVGAMKAGGDYTAMGDAINVASRLESAAKPGEVLVGPDTYLATHHVIHYESVGPLTVKGRSEPVDTWRALSPATLPGSKPHSHRAPMVGREIEFGLLSQVAETSVKKSRAYMAMILGEAGVGKTRLAHEIADMAVSEYGAQVLEGRCLPYGEANIWWPIASALRGACSVPDSASDQEALLRCQQFLQDLPDESGRPDASKELSRTASGLMYLMGYDAGGESGRNRESAIRAAQDLVSALARQSPVVFIVGELQWADDEVLELIDNLLERVKNQPVLMLALARTEIEERWRPRLSGRNLLSVTLDTLDEGAASALVESLLGASPTDELRSFLLSRSGGNPFFIEELVAYLLETGEISEIAEGRIGFDLDSGSREMPATLRGLISARLDSLTDSERSVIEAASVIGRRGQMAHLGGMFGETGTADIGETVDSLVAKELLARRNGEFEFRSDLTREVAYETLTKSERARRHTVAARSLAELPGIAGSDTGRTDQLASHFGKAALLTRDVGGLGGVSDDLRAEALEWIERAALRAQEGERSVDAERHFTRMLELLRGEERAERKRALLGRSHAQAWLHRLDEARRDATEALEMARADDDEASVAAALTAIGAAERLGNNLRGASQLFEEAVGLWKKVGDQSGEAEALRAWAMTDLFAGNLEPVRWKLDRAIEIYREIGDLRGEGLALQSVAWAAFRAGDIEESENWVSRSLKVFEQVEVEGSEAWALGLLAWLRYTQGRWREAGDIATDLLARLKAESGPPWAVGMIEILLSQVARADGRIRDSILEARQAHTTFESIGDQWGVLQALLPLSVSLMQSGEPREAIEVLGQALEVLEGLTDPRLAVQAGVSAAAVHVMAGDAASALESLEMAQEVGEIPLASGGGELKTAEVLATLMAGESGRALEMAELVRAELEQTTAFPSFATALAFCHLVQGEPSLAKELAERSLGSGGWLTDQVRAQIALGLAETRLGNQAAALEAFRVSAELAASAEAHLEWVKARYARAMACEELGLPDADRLRSDAEARLNELGISHCGWQALYGAALGRDADA